MIKNILWDFDGVIIDSMKIKGEGFKELFKEYDKDKVIELEKYHYENGGVSRFDKIKYFYTVLCKKEVNESEILNLAEEFSSIIKKKLYDEDNLIDESISFIKKNYQKYNFHIVSGAEHNELNDLCKNFKLTPFFNSIDGSPTPKDRLVKNILETNKYKKEETILIGDAITDYNAARVNKIGFYGYNNKAFKENENYINNFKDLKL